METKIRKYSGEPIVFHLHKNRLFLDKLTKKDKPPPPTTKQILDKIIKERNEVDAKVDAAMSARDEVLQRNYKDTASRTMRLNSLDSKHNAHTTLLPDFASQQSLAESVKLNIDTKRLSH